MGVLFAELEASSLYAVWRPHIVGSAMEKSPSIQITGGNIYGNVIAEVSGANAQVTYTHNDLATLEALVNEMSAHRAELPLTTKERTQ